MQGPGSWQAREGDGDGDKCHHEGEADQHE